MTIQDIKIEITETFWVKLKLESLQLYKTQNAIFVL